MPRGKSTHDQNILAMALVGYEVEKKRIEERIKEIRAKLGGGRVAAKASPAESQSGAPKRRKLSKAARKRIALAQKKRWAEHRKATGQASKGE
jgi:hypothetical protein